MEGVFQEGNQKVPTISFDPTTGVFEIKGNSIPENAGAIYEPIIELLKKYKDQPAEKTILNIELSYFNTSSSKWILNILRMLKEMNSETKAKVEINWKYEAEDDEMLEAAEDYESILRIPINKIEIQED